MLLEKIRDGLLFLAYQVDINDTFGNCSFFSSVSLPAHNGLTIGGAAGKKKKRELTESLSGGDCLWIKIYNIFWKLPAVVALRKQPINFTSLLPH